MGWSARKLGRNKWRNGPTFSTAQKFERKNLIGNREESVETLLFPCFGLPPLAAAFRSPSSPSEYKQCFECFVVFKTRTKTAHNSQPNCSALLRRPFDKWFRRQNPQPPPSVEDLFTTLNRHTQSSSFDNAVRLADQILGVALADEDALRCKVVALIKADKFDSSLSAIHSSRTPPPDFHHLKAYCLYRQVKLDEALESLKRQERSEESMLLEAQILYRLGKMDACVDIYGMLQKSKIDNMEINSVASLVMARRSSEVQGMLYSLRIKATSSFELAYNTACSLIERKKYTDAEQLLLSGRRIGQEILMEDNLADDEIELELSPIAVQLAYVQQLLGHKQEAIEAYADIIKQDMADKHQLQWQ